MEEAGAELTQTLFAGQFENVQADSPPGTGGVAEGRGGRPSPKKFLLELVYLPGSPGSPSPPVPGGES